MSRPPSQSSSTMDDDTSPTFPFTPPKKILNKTQFYEKWMKLQLGNRPRCFESLAELLAHEGDDIEAVSIRSKTPGGRCLYNVEVRTIEEYCREHGISDDDVVFQENLPDEILAMQGNITRDPQGGGIVLEFSTERNVKYREAMTRAQRVHGLVALGMLKSRCDPNSYEDLMELLDEFPDSTLEFAVYERNLGVLPHRNTIVFEVRNY